MLSVRKSIATIALTALAATACGGSGEPAGAADALIAAMKATFEGSYDFELGAEISGGARDAMIADDPSAGPGLAMVGSARLAGRANGGDMAMSLELLGSSLFELRSIGDGDLYLQLNTQLIADLSEGAFDPQALVGELGSFGLPPEFNSLAGAALQGDWIGITGLADISLDDLGIPPELLQQSGANTDDVNNAIERIRTEYADPTTFVSRFADVAEASGEDGARVFDLTIRVDDLIRSAAELTEEIVGQAVPADEVQRTIDEAPATVEGLTVTTKDGVVTDIVLDIGRIAASFPDSPPELGPGDVLIQVAFSNHGGADAVDVPDATTIGADELFGLVGTFLTGFGGAGFGGEDFAVDTGGFGSANLEEDVRSIATAQETYYTDFQTYSEDIFALLGVGFFPTSTEAEYATCTYDGGQGFIAGARDAGGMAYFFDSADGTLTDVLDAPACEGEWVSLF